MLHIGFGNYSGLVTSRLKEYLLTFLSQEELGDYHRFPVAARKDEYLGSRLVVKKIAREAWPFLSDLNLSSFQVKKETSGIPFIHLSGKGRLPGWVSISHSFGYAVAACSPELDRFGVDIEHIEPHSWALVEDFFTPLEMKRVKLKDSSKQDLYKNLIWSAKEAVLKAAGVGLNIDTRKIEITGISTASMYPGWGSFNARISDIMMESPLLLWRQMDSCILTLCVQTPKPDLSVVIRVLDDLDLSH